VIDLQAVRQQVMQLTAERVMSTCRLAPTFTPKAEIPQSADDSLLARAGYRKRGGRYVKLLRSTPAPVLRPATAPAPAPRSRTRATRRTRRAATCAAAKGDTDGERRVIVTYAAEDDPAASRAAVGFIRELIDRAIANGGEP